MQWIDLNNGSLDLCNYSCHYCLFLKAGGGGMIPGLWFTVPVLLSHTVWGYHPHVIFHVCYHGACTAWVGHLIHALISCMLPWVIYPIPCSFRWSNMWLQWIRYIFYTSWSDQVSLKNWHLYYTLNLLPITEISRHLCWSSCQKKWIVNRSSCKSVFESITLALRNADLNRLRKALSWWDLKSKAAEHDQAREAVSWKCD